MGYSLCTKCDRRGSCLTFAADIMKIAADRQLAVMILKGINQFPENGDRLGGTIDIWWIVRILRLFQRVSPVVSLALRCYIAYVCDLLKLQLVIFNSLTPCFTHYSSYTPFLSWFSVLWQGRSLFFSLYASLCFSTYLSVCLFVSSHNFRATCESCLRHLCVFHYIGMAIFWT